MSDLGVFFTASKYILYAVKSFGVNSSFVLACTGTRKTEISKVKVLNKWISSLISFYVPQLKLLSLKLIHRCIF